MKIEIVNSLVGIKFRETINTRKINNSIILGYIKVTNGVAEISQNRGDKKGLYNVTIVRNSEHNTHLDKSFNSYSKSLGYIKTFIFKEDYTPLKNLLMNIL